RGFPQEGRCGEAGGAGRAASAGESAERSIGLGAVAGESGASSFGAGDGQSLLADVFWDRDRQDDGGFWVAGRVAESSRIAGLAGERICRERVGYQGVPEDDRDELDVSAVGAGHERDFAS